MQRYDASLDSQVKQRINHQSSLRKEKRKNNLNKVRLQLMEEDNNQIEKKTYEQAKQIFIHAFQTQNYELLNEGLTQFSILSQTFNDQNLSFNKVNEIINILLPIFQMENLDSSKLKKCILYKRCL